MDVRDMVPQGRLSGCMQRRADLSLAYAQEFDSSPFGSGPKQQWFERAATAACAASRLAPALPQLRGWADDERLS